MLLGQALSQGRAGNFRKPSGALNSGFFLLPWKQHSHPNSRRHPHPSYLASLGLKLHALPCKNDYTLSHTLPQRDTILISRWAASMGIAMAIVSRNRHQTFTQKVR
jgi:hypothetical protein